MEKPNYNTEDVVVKVIEKMGVPFSEQDIAIAHRLRGTQGKTRGIIVKLNSRGKKTEILKNKKRISNQTVFGEGEGMIFVSQSLSPFYRGLLMKAKKAAKENSFKFCWYVDEKILMKKDENATPLVIRNEEDLIKFCTDQGSIALNRRL